MLFLDGWKNLYLPLLKQLEPKLYGGGVRRSRQRHLFPDALKPYLDYVREPANGYVSVAVPEERRGRALGPRSLEWRETAQDGTAFNATATGHGAHTCIPTSERSGTAARDEYHGEPSN